MTETERYLILIEGGPPSNYSAWSPDVLGCVATGDTIEECVNEMRTALAGHLDLIRESGEAIPEASGPGVYIEHAVVAA
ncbi:MAG TPA: type II toxin-antitoxin system HicB family antitoxin [Solirubrobacteraceae bacterium]|jgi:predicted RNase H-like HicB family nuclease